MEVPTTICLAARIAIMAQVSSLRTLETDLQVLRAIAFMLVGFDEVGLSPKITPDFTRTAMSRSIHSIIQNRMSFDNIFRLLITYDFEHQSQNVQRNQEFTANLLKWEIDHGKTFEGYVGPEYKRRSV